MSQLAYETRFPDKIGRIARGWGLQEIRCLRETVQSTLPMASTRGVLATSGEAAILAFAGTDPLNLVNWVTDFSLGRFGADVHEGFEAAAAAVWEDVGSAIRQASEAGRRLLVTGHSLGAAIAVVTLARAGRDLGLGRAQVYLFGCPRVGRERFAAQYDTAFGPTTYRLVHGKDVVATVPPPEIGFRHVGRYLSCGRNGSFDPTHLLAEAGSNAPLPDDEGFRGIFRRLSDLLSGPPSRASRADAIGAVSQILAPAIGDHLPDRYCAALT